MSEKRAKGSIILEVLIALLIVVLVMTVYIPKTIWDTEEEMKVECRARMDNIMNAEIQYKMRTSVYNETLNVVFNYLSQDSTISDSFSNYFTMPFDSMYSCPQTGLDYTVIVQTDTTPNFQVLCPTDADTLEYMKFYEKKTANHGSIKDGDKIWE